MTRLPRIAVIVGLRFAHGVCFRSWGRLLIVIGGVWIAILLCVTTMRITAAKCVPTAAEPAAGITASCGFDLLAPEHLIARVSAFLLTATGISSSFITWFTSPQPESVTGGAASLLRSQETAGRPQRSPRRTDALSSPREASASAPRRSPERGADARSGSGRRGP